MQHYEIIIMIHPDKSEQISTLIDQYRNLINNNYGKINRLEDWGRRYLSYPIQKLHKAHYILLNIETSKEIIDQIQKSFNYNSIILRSSILRVKHAIYEASPMIKRKNELSNTN